MTLTEDNKGYLNGNPKPRTERTLRSGFVLNGEIVDDSYALHHFNWAGISSYKSIEEGIFVSGQLSNVGTQEIE